MSKEIIYKKTIEELIKNRTIYPLGRYKSSFYIKGGLFFKEETDRTYYELLGSKVAEYLGIKCTSYEEAEIVTPTRTIKGLLSKDYRKKDSYLVKFSKILEPVGGEMTLDNIELALETYFKKYINKDEIVNNIYNEVISHYMLDLLLGNIDNGKYNYELIVGISDASLSPYSDFGMTFNFQNTQLRVNNEVNNDIYKNLELLLQDNEYYNKFISMYDKLNPMTLEKLMEELEKEKQVKLNDNFKNIVFLSYSRHYMMIENIINSIKKSKKNK